jgi:uncharacterized membrane protein
LYVIASSRVSNQGRSVDNRNLKHKTSVSPGICVKQPKSIVLVNSLSKLTKTFSYLHGFTVAVVVVVAVVLAVVVLVLLNIQINNNNIFTCEHTKSLAVVSR